MLAGLTLDKLASWKAQQLNALESNPEHNHLFWITQEMKMTIEDVIEAHPDQHHHEDDWIAWPLKELIETLEIILTAQHDKSFKTLNAQFRELLMPSGEAIIADPNKVFEFIQLINKRYCQAHNEDNTVEKEKEYATTLLDKLKKDHNNTSLTIY